VINWDVRELIIARNLKNKVRLKKGKLGEKDVH
jgi:hypothetical protein